MLIGEEDAILRTQEGGKRRNKAERIRNKVEKEGKQYKLVYWQA